jgi:hypothetical protein
MVWVNLRGCVGVELLRCVDRWYPVVTTAASVGRRCGVDSFMDVGAVAAAVALMAGTGAVQGIGEQTALAVVARIRARIRAVFGRDERSVDALERAVECPQDQDRVGELAAALAWYAQRDEGFAEELREWAATYAPSGPVNQQVHAGRDAYTAGRDMTVQQRPETS